MSRSSAPSSTEALHLRFVQSLPELGGRADSAALVNLVLSALRGMGVVRLFGAAPARERPQLQMLAQWIETHCRSASPTGQATRRQRPPASSSRSNRRK